jgi:hypothetical protein
MTFTQRAAQIFGWGFIVVGVAGFFATGMSMDANPATAEKLLRIFPLNAVHNIVHLLFGAWGVGGSRAWGSARTFLVAGGVIYLLLAALGFVAPAGFGLVPLGGADIGLHVFLAAGMLLAGLLSRAPSTRTATRITV